MPWLKVSDMATHHPIVVAPMEFDDYDERLVNEVFGFVARCALQSAAHLTDYVVSKATAMQIAGMTRAAELLEVAIAAGYFTPLILEDGRTAYKLCEDNEFMHIRSREEVEWERQRKRDNSNPAINVPVRLRDGDGCRWCGVVVNWSDRKGARGATYDHLEPQRGSTVETTVVACKSCNSSRKDGPTPPGVAELLPAPTDPYYSKSTIKWLTESKWRQDQGLPVPAPSATQVPTGYRVDGTQPPTPDLPQDRVSHSNSDPLGRGSTDAGTQPANQQPSPPDPEPADRSWPTDGIARRTDRATHRQDRAAADDLHAPPHGQPPPTPATGSTDICQISTDPDRSRLADEGSFPDSSGRVGPGRVEPGQVGDPATSSGEGSSQTSRAQRRRRRNRRNNHNQEVN